MPSLKEKIENNLAVFFLTALAAGFLAGLGAYETALRISGRTTIAADWLKTLQTDLIKAQDAARSSTQRIPCCPAGLGH